MSTENKEVEISKEEKSGVKASKMKKGRKTIAYLHEKKDNGEKIVQICPADRDKYFVMAAVHFQPHLSSGGYYDNMNNSDPKDNEWRRINGTVTKLPEM